MPHSPYDRTLERNRKVVEAFQAEPLGSREALARRFGVSPQVLDRILKDAGTGPPQRRPRIKLIDMPPLSDLHWALGAVLDEHLRKLHAGKLTDHAFGSGVGSTQRLSMLLLGVQDITLTELQRLAAYVGSTPGEILAAAIEKESALCPSRFPSVPKQKLEATG